VAPGSYYYEDVLLGLGWSAIQARQWGDCINVGSALAQISEKTTLQCEGALIKSYGFIMQKNYTAAHNELRVALDLFVILDPPPEDSLALNRNSCNLKRQIYDAISLEAEKLSLAELSFESSRDVDSLHIIQDAMQDSLRTYEKYEDEFFRSKFFYRSTDKIREDIEYTLAVVDNLLKKSGAVKVQEKLKEQTQDIDKEIQMLEQQMQQIQKTE
jgi:hypothetical protein